MPHKEYQSVVNKLKEATTKLQELEAENERLRIALYMYAEKLMTQDGGRTAKEALKGGVK